MLEKVKSALLCMQRYSWEQAVAALAFHESGDEDIALRLVYDAVNRQTPDGRLGNMGGQNAVTDPVAILPVLVWAYDKTQDPTLKAALDKAWQWSLHDAPRNKKGIVYHMDNAQQFWVDSLYMFPPALLSGGYVDEAIKQADGYVDALYDNQVNLFRHIWDDEKQVFEVSAYWGVGNGWAIAGLSRMIEGLPSSKDEVKKRYIAIVSDTCQAALKYEADGLFHNFLTMPDSFIEANFAQMLCYTVYKGVKQGWLDAKFLERVNKIREKVHQSVNQNGYVTPVCGAPFFNSPGIAPEGQAFHILMESAFARM